MAILIRECIRFRVWTCSIFPLRKLGTFALFQLPALLWGSYLLKWKVVFLKCNKGFNRTLSIYVVHMHHHMYLWLLWFIHILTMFFYLFPFYLCLYLHPPNLRVYPEKSSIWKNVVFFFPSSLTQQRTFCLLLKQI